MLGFASPVTGHQTDAAATPIKVRYFPCPQCGQLMNRMNFARCSGVIVDVCRGHGTWFDASELRAIIEFIRRGGLQLSRQKEKLEIESERAQLRYQQSITNKSAEGFSFSEDERLSGILATSQVLEFMD